MRILYVSQYFPPEMGAPAARVYELAREWVRLGHSVQVLTGFPNHPTGVIAEGYRGELWRKERVGGIEVCRVPIYAAPNRDLVRSDRAPKTMLAGSAEPAPVAKSSP